MASSDADPPMTNRTTEVAPAVAVKDEAGKEPRGPAQELAAEASKQMAVSADDDGEEADGEEDGDEAAEKNNNKYRMPQHQIDFILSWDVAEDVSPNLARIDGLPFSEAEEGFRAGELRGVAARNQLRRMTRERQQSVRGQIQEHGYILDDDR